MKIMIIGSTGFVGRSIIRSFLSRNIETVALVRKNTAEKKAPTLNLLKKWGCTIKILDIYNHRELEDILKSIKPDVLVYSAGILRGPKEEFIRVHVDLPSIILDSIYKSNTKPIYIHISSTGASNFSIDQRPLPEEREHCSHINELPTIYEKSKCMGEKVVIEKSQRYNLNYIILRPNLIIGELNRHREWINMIRFAKLGIKLNLPGVTNVLNVRDLAELIIHIAKTGKGLNNFYHVASPKSISIYRISEIALDILERRSIISIGSSLIKIAKLFTLSQIDRRMFEFLDKDSRVSINKMANNLNYDPNSFRDPEESFRDMFKSIIQSS